VRADTDEVRWVHAKARIEQDRRGRPSGLLGVGMDVDASRSKAKASATHLRRRLMYAQEDDAAACAGIVTMKTASCWAAAMLDLKRSS